MKNSGYVIMVVYPIISNTVVAASGLHTKLKKMVSEQGESDFAQYVAGLVKYVRRTGDRSLSPPSLAYRWTRR